MKQEEKKWYYFIFDEVTGGLYEGGGVYGTRADAFERIQELYYFFLNELRKAGKKTLADQLRSIIKDDQDEAIWEYIRITGKETRL